MARDRSVIAAVERRRRAELALRSADRHLNRTMRRAREDGVSLGKLAQLTGLSRTQCHRITTDPEDDRKGNNQ